MQPIYRISALVNDLELIDTINDSLEANFPQFRIPPTLIKRKLRKAKVSLELAYKRLERKGGL